MLVREAKTKQTGNNGGNDILPHVSLILCQIEALDCVTYLVVDGTATVLEDDLADGVGGGEEGVVGEAVGGENPIEVGHQGRCELGLGREEVEGGRFCISLCRSSPALFSSAIVLVCPCTITITTHHP